jgi:multidrug efflux system outer membrane protein
MSALRMNAVRTALISLLLLAQGCTLGPDYRAPESDLPASWDLSSPGTTLSGTRWWTLYGDAALERLVDEALTHNQDLALATARVDEARALARVADSQLVPAVDAGFNRNRVRSSSKSSTPLPPSIPLERNTYRGQINIAYELDLWGRLRDTAKAAYADLLASKYARDTLRLVVASEAVKGYYGLAALDSQLAATQRSLALRRENLRLQKVRADAGLIDNFALRQLEAEVAAAEAQLPGLEQQRTAQELALGVLLGRSPRALLAGRITPEPADGQPAAAVIPQGLPSDLLLRRPDIREAEQRLIAANARIGAARASLFPQISLTGFYGTDSAQLGDLFTIPARIWQLGYALSQPIFQGGRLFGQIESIEAREKQSLAQYLKTVQSAFRETREALLAQTRARETFSAETERVKSLSESLRLARIRYENGISSQLELLDAERNLLAAELNRAAALRAQRTTVADVVRALGGGWEKTPPPNAANAASNPRP